MNIIFLCQRMHAMSLMLPIMSWCYTLLAKTTENTFIEIKDTKQIEQRSKLPGTRGDAPFLIPSSYLALLSNCSTENRKKSLVATRYDQPIGFLQNVSPTGIYIPSYFFLFFKSTNIPRFGTNMK